jgi:hypothetical protein
MVPRRELIMISLSRRYFFTGMIATTFARFLPQITAVLARQTSWEIVTKTWDYVSLEPEPKIASS